MSDDTLINDNYNANNEIPQRVEIQIENNNKYSNLHDWWFNALTNEERNTVISLYHPFGLDRNPLAPFYNREIKTSNQKAVKLLSELSSWFKKPDTRQIAYKILKQAEFLVTEKTPVLDKHFLYQAKIEIYYRNRNIDDFALSTAVEACRQQIAISKKAKVMLEKDGLTDPSHVGYKQLCILMEKQQNYDEVIRLASEAKAQGWGGDWDKRIEKCMKKRASRV